MAREIEKFNENVELPIHNDIRGRTGSRLVSRKPLWVKMESPNNFEPENDWRNMWNEARLMNSHLVDDPKTKLRGRELDRKTWTQLNRIRTNNTRCNYTLNKWNPMIDRMCDCGHQYQTIPHIVNDCITRKFMNDDAVEWRALHLM